MLLINYPRSRTHWSKAVRCGSNHSWHIREEAYADAGEYLRALIRADRRRAVEEKIERFVEEALESGPAETMTDAEWAAMHRALDGASGSL